MLEEFLKNLDWDKVRVKRYPNLIFLCGSANSTKSIRSLLRANPLKNYRYVLAESAMNWPDAKSFTSDFLELEEYFAAAVKLILIISESPGAFAEMGAFVSNKKIKTRVLVVTQESHYKAHSFIRYGVIQHLQGKSLDPTPQICVIPDITPLRKKELLAHKQEILEAVEDSVQSFPQKSSVKFDASETTSRVFLVRDIIALNSIIEKTQLQRIFRMILHQNKQSFKNKDFLKILFCLEKLGMIEKHFKGNKVLYKANDYELYLRYPTSSYEESAVALQRKIRDQFYHKSRDISLHLKPIELSNAKDLTKESYSQFERKLFSQLPLMYKVFNIPKKNGKGMREIAQPTSFLKKLQKRMISDLESKFEIHNAAKAYIRGQNGIQQNASVHVDGKYFLKLDFHDFFHNIKASSLNWLLLQKNFSLSERVKYLKVFFMFNKSVGKEQTKRVYKILKSDRSSEQQVLELMTKEMESEFRLSIGAPSSPWISNIVMYEFDEKVATWCKKQGINYSRYADDLSFSSMDNKKLKKVIFVIEKILKKISYLHLSLNKNKTKYLSLKQKVNITGLNITSEHKTSVGRQQKKLIRVMLYHFQQGKLSVDKKEYLKGWVSYIKSVEPAYYRSLNEKFNSELKQLSR